MCREPRRRIWYRTAALEPGLGNRRTGIEPAGKANAFAIWNLPSDTAWMADEELQVHGHDRIIGEGHLKSVWLVRWCYLNLFESNLNCSSSGVSCKFSDDVRVGRACWSIWSETFGQTDDQTAFDRLLRNPMRHNVPTAGCRVINELPESYQWVTSELLVSYQKVNRKVTIELPAVITRLAILMGPMLNDRH